MVDGGKAQSFEFRDAPISTKAQQLADSGSLLSRN